jgi:iron complex outermembrane receptor protein
MDMKGKRALLTSPLLLVSSLALADPTYQFDIRGESLQAALRQFAEQSGLQVSYFTKIAEGHGAPPVSGTLTAEQALQTLLSASGLRFERIDSRTVAIYSATSQREITAVSGETGAMQLPRPKLMRLARASENLGSSNETIAPNLRREEILEEVVSTGTHIRGVVNDTAPLIVMDRQYIERSGFTSMQQLVDSLPMNFKGGSSGATESAEFGAAPAYGQNLTRGTGFNLRGLGSVATLTLINGRRVAPSAQGQFVDVSTIPMSAVERVEVLSDGASAIYGADAIAGVVNIILRKDYEGAETSLIYGSASDGAFDNASLAQTFGTSWDTGNTLLVLEGRRRSALDVKDRDYMMEAGARAPTWILPDRKLGTLLFALDQQLPAGFDVSLNALYSYEEVITESSIQGALDRQTPFTNQWSAMLSLGYAAPGDWRITLDGTLGRVKTDTDFVIIYPDGEIGGLLQDYVDDFTTWGLDLKADGSLFDLPAGPVRLAVGGAYRNEDLISTRWRLVPNTGFEVRADDTRNVKAAFAELYVPIVGAAQQLSWAKRIDLSVATRHDDYSDFGSTTNPKVGLVWSPVESLDLRATYSTSFRAPNVAEKARGRRPQQVSTMRLPDPVTGELIGGFFIQGSMPLVAEESENLAFGFTFRPQAIAGLELSMNYFDIDYTNRIQSPPFDAGALSRRDEFGEVISDFASDAEAQAFLDAVLAAGGFFIDWEEIGTTGIRFLYDQRQKNAARARVSGFDANINYNLTLERDSFQLQLAAAHLRKLTVALSEQAKPFDMIDTYSQPLNWRFRALGTWTRGGFSGTLGISHSDKYRNDSQLIDVPVGSFTVIDLNLGYSFDDSMRGSFLEGVRVALNIGNLADRDPPRAVSPDYPIGYDAFNADPAGRYITAFFTKRW